MNEARTLTTIFIVVAFVIVSAAAFDNDHVLNEQERYCEMVSIWLADAKEGIPANKRDGWPPYKAESLCSETSE